ncbi:hypothetical protein D3C75_1155860 [compost metagenome]
MAATLKAGDTFFSDGQGNKQQVDSPFVTVNGKMYVSLNFVSSAFGVETKAEGLDLFITSK